MTRYTTKLRRLWAWARGHLAKAKRQWAFKAALRRLWAWAKKKKRQRAFEKALRCCNTVAREEYPFAQNGFDGAKNLVLKLQDQMATIGGGAANRQGTATQEAREKLAELSRYLDKAITKELATASDSLSGKRDSLEQFTVTLFGRTMTGKSTIREAITQGDGSTIGKGGQRTTRDIQTYEWKALRIVDTPGIGGYKGEADATIARSVIDESDVLLFLTHSDGIQDSSFRGMRDLRDQNKPIIFVLNVKRDLTTGRVRMKKFLQSPESIMGQEKIGGHIDRIRRLAEEELGMRRVNIVPIHAQAAFLATRPEYKDRSAELHEASGIDNLLDALMDEVLERGTVRRLQTLLDGTIIKLMDFEERVKKKAQSLSQSAKHLKGKFAELNTWFDRYIGNRDRRIGHYTSEVLRPLRDSVSVFVDENIERADVEARWKKQMESMKLDEKVEDFQKQLQNEVREHLEEFQREVAFEWELMDEITIHGPEQYNPLDVRKGLGWIGAVSGALAGVAGVAWAFGAANFWNPVGWIAGVVAAGFGILSLLSVFNREKKLQRQKNEVANQLRNQIDSMERRIVSEIKKWFDRSITSDLMRIRRETPQFYNGMFQLSRALGEVASTLRADIEALNRRLLIRCGALVGEKITEDSISDIARAPGIQTKFISAAGAVPSSFCREVGKALGEEVSRVERDRQHDKIGEGLPTPPSASVPKSAPGSPPPNNKGSAIKRQGYIRSGKYIKTDAEQFETALGEEVSQVERDRQHDKIGEGLPAPPSASVPKSAPGSPPPNSKGSAIKRQGYIKGGKYIKTDAEQFEEE